MKIHSGLIVHFFTLIALANYSQTASTFIKPVTSKHDLSVSLVYLDTLSLPSFTEFDLPVKMQTGHDISAISLGFYFPEEFLEIIGMELASVSTGFYYSVNDSLFIMAWSNVNTIHINDEDTIITLKMKSLNLAGLMGTIKLGIYELSEFADQAANPIEGIVLEIPEIEYLVPDVDDSLGGNYVRIYPNPFNDYTSVNFYLKDESKVTISLFNMAGMSLEKEVAFYPEGTHQVVLHSVDFAIGVYLLKFEIGNSEGSNSKVIKVFNCGISL